MPPFPVVGVIFSLFLFTILTLQALFTSFRTFCVHATIFTPPALPCPPSPFSRYFVRVFAAPHCTVWLLSALPHCNSTPPFLLSLLSILPHWYSASPHSLLQSRVWPTIPLRSPVLESSAHPFRTPAARPGIPPALPFRIPPYSLCIPPSHTLPSSLFLATRWFHDPHTGRFSSPPRPPLSPPSTLCLYTATLPTFYGFAFVPASFVRIPPHLGYTPPPSLSCIPLPVPALAATAPPAPR